MSITLVKYTAKDNEKGIKLVLNNETLYVPLDPNNRHYQEIQEWVAAGNKIEEAD